MREREREREPVPAGNGGVDALTYAAFRAARERFLSRLGRPASPAVATPSRPAVSGDAPAEDRGRR
jgi:hypothetical protein